MWFLFQGLIFCGVVGSKHPLAMDAEPIPRERDWRGLGRIPRREVLDKLFVKLREIIGLPAAGPKLELVA
jgi:hypothetical protein